MLVFVSDTTTTMEDAHCYEFSEVLRNFNCKEEVGLSDGQVKDNQAKYGPNGMLKFCGHTFLVFLLEKF